MKLGNVLGWLAVLGFCLSNGCAKYPAGGNSLITKRLILTIKLEGKVRYGQDLGQLPYIYVMALRLSTDQNPKDSGPEPVTNYGGNGFVAGNCTHFILFNPSAANPYEIWQFRDTSMNDRFLTGYAINYQDPRQGSQPAVLQCEIDLSQLVPAGDVDSIQSIQANLFTMDRYALDSSGHSWDALGNSRISSQDNTYLTFDLRSSRVITNNQTGLEPPGNDVNGSNDPDLNLVDWSIEVRLQQ